MMSNTDRTKNIQKQTTVQQARHYSKFKTYHETWCISCTLRGGYKPKLCGNVLNMTLIE